MEVGTETQQPNYDRSIDDNNDDDVNGSKSSKKEHRSIGYFELFSYATPCEYIYLLIATLAAILRSSAFPLVIVIYSEMIAMFIDRSLGTTTKTYFLPLFDGGKILFNATHEENMMELKNDAKAFGILSGLNTLSLFLMGIIYVDLYNYVALNILVRLRCKYYQHVIRQDISWHDTIDQQNFASIITDNMEKIRNGISETIGHFIQLLFDIIISIVISFVYGWRLTLTVCAYIPITMIVNYVVSKYQTKLTASEQSAYSKASSVAEEVLAAIRTVIAFGGEKHERQRYNELLVPARKAGKLKGIFSGLNDSLLKAMLFLCSAATFWHGVHLVLNDRDKDPNDKEYTPEILMIVICGIIVGAQHISYTAPFLEGFAIAKGSAIPIYNVLESRSKIDPLSSHGKILNYGLKGDIEFQDVFFHYPSRPNSIVLRGFNLKVKSGETVALVGTSGSGKSTCIQLLLRFYDPIFGKILIDDEDLRKYNVNWLRSNVAVVGQEPVLFFGTIEENIRYGKMDAAQKEIEDAAKIAGAHDFIISLPESYKTSISEKGVQLSGGQRQRIAIARALIQNPKILLLDEATSALDYQSEKLIQNALDNASKGRTTIVISHRLSAICQAHRIIFIENGKIVEEGDHETLILQKGHYYNMVATQEYEGTLRDNNTENFDLNIYNEVDVKKCDFNSVLEEQWEESKVYVGLKNNFIENELHNTKANKLDKAETEEDTTKFMRTFLRVLKWSKPEWGYLIIGTVCAALYGCTQPVFAIILAELFGSLSEKEPDEVLRQSTKTSIISTIVGVVAGITCLAQTYFFNLAGVWLTTRMRSAAFKKILKQDMAWFDEKENSVGALSARLAGDACGVQGAIGFPLSNILQALFNLICSFSIGFAYSWELALICLSTAPFMVAAILFEAKFNNKSALEEKRILEETSRIATESIAQIRTVAALRRETELIKLYKMEVMKYYRQIKGRLRFRGLVSSLGLSIMFFGYSITLTYGGYMSANGRIEFKEIIKISNSLLYGLFILAQSLAFTPAFNAALLSANRLFNIIDRKPQILSPNLKITTDFKQPRHQNNNNLTHAVDYRNIKFQYPTRPGQKVLNGFNLAIMQGKTVGLVGASGSGKSTCIQLLLRYYDPDSGQILIDNENIQLDMSLDNLRQRFGIVAQEPSLFENTIAENIAYGDNSRPVPMDEIIKAAKIANAHDFIINLPKAYETCLGARGTQLSGGQKQRIAIARALIRNPKILLLDEATSALDIQSENIVQKALDEACSGRTCLIIAHRLSTIQNADLICVIKNGHIVEQGNHTHLLNRNGIYAKLYRSQPNALTTTTKTTPPLPTSRIL